MKKIISHIRLYLKWYVLVTLIFISIALWSIATHENRDGLLKVVFLNVGQGDSIFVESPTGVQVLIDGGPNNNLSKELPKVLPWYDRHIDMLVITHPDKDHYEGFISFLKKYSTDVVLVSGTQNDSAGYEILKKEIIDKKIPEILARRGQMVDLGQGAYLEIIFPDRDVSGLETNNGSIVMRLVYGETSVMFQGDSTANMEHYLVGLNEYDLKSTILKAGHHGSKTSSTEEYVKAVSPEWVIISAGKNNTHGHPHKEVLDIFEKLKIKTLATCSSGRIDFQSDGKEFILKNKKTTEVEIGCKQ